jgi:serpin B
MTILFRPLIPLAAFALFAVPLVAAETAAATRAVNELGLKLLPLAAPASDNALLSPYSIQLALAMTYAGADGETHQEMARVLSFPAEEKLLHASFANLNRSLADAAQSSAQQSEALKKSGGRRDPLQFRVANRLYCQSDQEFRQPFLELLRDVYRSPLEQVDFIANADDVARRINAWVNEQTAGRIQNLIPPGLLTKYTRLVLVNALYFKAAWQDAFRKELTSPQPFHVRGAAATINVPTMMRRGMMGVRDFKEFTAVSLPYDDGELQLLVLVPRATDGWMAVQGALNAAILAECAKLPRDEVDLSLPKFQLQPETMRLGEALQKLGMRTAFDKPGGTANFDRMAPRKPDDYLKISEVVHKTFISVDEEGTEAAAATAVIMAVPAGIAPQRKEPRIVVVDRPFLFAIQHLASGTCLFLGRVTDPR